MQELIKDVGLDRMTSREIAELTGKRHDHVMRDCAVLNENYEKMGLPKLGETPYTHPQNGQTYRQYSLTKMQTMDLMTGYNTELRIRVNRRWEELEKAAAKQPTFSIEEMMINQLQSMIEVKNKVSVLESTTQQMESKIDQIDARTQTRPDWYTIVGYGTLFGLPSFSVKQAAVWGRAAAGMAKEMGIQLDSCPDPRFGRVNIYPKFILDKVLKSK